MLFTVILCLDAIWFIVSSYSNNSKTILVLNPTLNTWPFLLLPDAFFPLFSYQSLKPWYDSSFFIKIFYSIYKKILVVIIPSVNKYTPRFLNPYLPFIINIDEIAKNAKTIL